jgi:hypothetical protein
MSNLQIILRMQSLSSLRWLILLMAGSRFEARHPPTAYELAACVQANCQSPVFSIEGKEPPSVPPPDDSKFSHGWTP